VDRIDIVEDVQINCRPRDPDHERYATHHQVVFQRAFEGLESGAHGSGI
jgi:hypothetical protein